MNASVGKLALSDMLRPVSQPRVIENVYTDDQFQRMVNVIRKNGPWDLILKHHFSSVEEIIATTTGGADIDTSKLTMDMFLSPAFRGSSPTTACACTKKSAMSSTTRNS